MPRIPDTELEKLKRDISLERLAQGQGIVLKRHGQDLLGLCPFHDDHEPSLVISPAKNLWHCLGACQAGGSVIDWVMKREGVSFRHAVELLKNDLPLAASARAPVKASTVRRLDAPITANDDDQAALTHVIDYYHKTLKQSPEALAYLQKRGLTNAAIDHFKLGYANRTLGYRLPEKNRKDGAAFRGQLQRLGLLRSSGHEHFAGSLIVPVFDDVGHVTEVYGRKVNDKLREGTPRHLYLPGPHQGVWNLKALKVSKEIILCEALIDALTFWCAGYRNVTSSYGVEGFTADHLAAFKHYSTERILIAYDRDEAGESAASRLAEKLLAEGIDCYRIHFPKGMDANDYALHVQPASKSLGVVIRSAVWLGKGKSKPSITTVTTDSVTDFGINESEAPALNLATDAHFQQQLTEIAEHLAVMNHVAPQESAAPVVEPAPLPASPVPPAPVDVPADVSDDEVVMTFNDRRYRVRGLAKNLSYDQLRVNVLVSRSAADGTGDLIHVDTFDLYAARHRSGFVRQASIELGIKEDTLKKDIGQVLLKLEALQDALIKKSLAPKDKTVTLSDTDHHDALALLGAPDLLDRLLTDFHACGVVGEETNKLVAYLAATSRKLDAPLAVIVQSSSAAGKSSLMDAVLAFMPEEDKVQYSAMTGQSLFYMDNGNLKHKILAIAEEEGAERASYALKLLQSEGELTIASTGKDPASGKLVTHEYRVEGPVMIFSTTTAIDPDEELLNRCLILGVDESREQTRAIHQLQRQRRTLQGLIAKQDKERLLKLHRNAQRLLRPLAVMNPYADDLTFLDDKTRLRRDHEKYLTLIDTIALLHQYQRPIKTTSHHGEALHYVEVTLDDIALANQLAHDVLGRTLDELPPQTRRLLRLVLTMVKQETQTQHLDRVDYRFTRREVRGYTGLSDTQLKLHLQRLVDLEYLLLHRQGPRFVYELLYDGDGEDGVPRLSGLIDVDTLRQKYAYDENRSGQTTDRSGSGRPEVGGQSGVGRGEEGNANSLNQSLDLTSMDESDKKAPLGKNNNAASYRSSTSHALVAKGR